MPLVKALLRAGVCNGDTAVVGGACGGTVHCAWMVAAAVAGALLVSFTVRLAWADFDVKRLEVRAGRDSAL